MAMDELEYEWYKRGWGLFREDPKLESFLSDLAGLLLYSSYNEVIIPKKFIEKIKGRIKKVFRRGEKTCIELENGDVWCAGLGDGVERMYIDIDEEEEMGYIEEEREEIRKEAIKATEEALKEGEECVYGWIDSDNPDGVATYELVICKE